MKLYIRNSNIRNSNIVLLYGEKKGKEKRKKNHDSRKIVISKAFNEEKLEGKTRFDSSLLNAF